MSNEENNNKNKLEKFYEKVKLGEITDERKDIMKGLIESYEDIFEYDGEKLGRVSIVKHKIEIKGDQEPIAQKRYKETDEKGKIIQKEIKQLLKMGKIRKSWSE